MDGGTASDDEHGRPHGDASDAEGSGAEDEDCETIEFVSAEEVEEAHTDVTGACEPLLAVDREVDLFATARNFVEAVSNYIAYVPLIVMALGEAAPAHEAHLEEIAGHIRYCTQALTTRARARTHNAALTAGLCARLRLSLVRRRTRLCTRPRRSPSPTSNRRTTPTRSSSCREPSGPTCSTCCRHAAPARNALRWSDHAADAGAPGTRTLPFGGVLNRLALPRPQRRAPYHGRPAKRARHPRRGPHQYVRGARPLRGTQRTRWA